MKSSIHHYSTISIGLLSVEKNGYEFGPFKNETGKSGQAYKKYEFFNE